MKLSEKIIKIRKENNLSQEEFGNKINVSRQAVSKWENEEAKPDTEKIQEIVKNFNVSYEYLLNDEIETMEKVHKDSDKKTKKKKLSKITKIIISVAIIYLIICIYKFIILYRFYTIANSFSEKNYWMAQNYNTQGATSSTENGSITANTTKIGNKILETVYSQSNPIKDENGENIPYSITYTDIDKKECYELYYNEDDKKYVYHDRKEDMVNNEEIESLFENKNHIKENTFGVIPSSIKTILMYSINPGVYYVDGINHEIRMYLPKDDANYSVKLSKDYLVERIIIKTGYNYITDVQFSYDYVQDHFTEIQNPIETYKNKIVYEK